MVKYNKEGEGFQYIKSKFPKISDVKIKEGVFIGPQIRELIKDPFFEETLKTLEKAAWNAFKSVTQNFLGNHRSLDYEQTIETLLHTYNAMGCNMSLKLHFLHSHLYFFTQNLGDVSRGVGSAPRAARPSTGGGPHNFIPTCKRLGIYYLAGVLCRSSLKGSGGAPRPLATALDVSDEHGERFHQDIATMENRYKGKCKPNMMADYCWSLKRDTSGSSHKRKANTMHF